MFSLCTAAGDWFNRIDWTGQHNNFGVGLPPASKNQHSWPFKQPLLAAADRYRPTPDIIARQAAYFKAILRVRWARACSAESYIGSQAAAYAAIPTANPLLNAHTCLSGLGYLGKEPGMHSQPFATRGSTAAVCW